MSSAPRTLNLVLVLRRTSTSAAYIERCKKVANDPDHAARILKHECRMCFYGSKVGGAMCTASNCIGCGQQMNFGSTCVDELCFECAKKHRLCRHCAADLEGKHRRKL